MTYAIVETSGTQIRVEPGRFYDVNRLAVAEDGAVTLDQVLYVSHEGNSLVGQPLVEGAVVSATVMRHLRGRKVIVYKMQPKKKTRKKRGHRQELTRIMIDAITMNGEVIAGEVAEEKPGKPEPDETPTPAEAVDAETTVVVDEAPAEVVDTPIGDPAPVAPDISDEDSTADDAADSTSAEDE